MIDVHCHLNFKSFQNDYDQVIKNATQAGVKAIINVGTKIDSSEWAVRLANQYENLYAIVGVHPHHADKIREGWEEKLEALTNNPKVVAIGEIGMDYYSYKSNGIVDPKQQKEVFSKQIALAHRLKLPLQIHNRHAGNHIIEILKAYSANLLTIPGMFHCFSGSMDVLKSALQMGFYIGFDGNITYKGLAPGENTTLKDLARHTPLDRIVIETDSPYLTPEPHRGTRNEPQYAILIGEFMAKLKGISFEELNTHVKQNVETLFKLNTKRSQIKS